MTRLSIFALSLFACSAAQAQLDVTLEVPRRIFVRGEAVEAKVSIRNLSGRDLTLSDLPNNQWFGFEVLRNGDTPVGPINPKYHNAPVVIPAGDSLTRTVDLAQLYPVEQLGSYKVRATINVAEMKKLSLSPTANIDISDGRQVWHQTVGVPSGMAGEGEMRHMALLSFQAGKELTLYCRVTDETTGGTLATYPLGRVLGGAKPMVEFSNDNTLYAFHMTAPSQYALTKIGVNGEWLGQYLYDSPSGRATVRKRPDGTMVVAGATRIPDPEKKTPGALPVPKLSDGPPVAVPVNR
jgi:hypothetical protein